MNIHSESAALIERLKNLKIAVVGDGVTGKALISYLKTLGISPLVIDEKESNSKLLITDRINLAIVSPGWKPSHQIFAQLKAQGTEILGEIDFAWRVKEELAPHQKWVGVTGTNGKTTTVQMVESIFKVNDINAIACGNIGMPAITAVTASPCFDYLVLELSSFQLEWNKEARFIAGALLNIAPDHIDWHGTLESYANSKLSLLRSSEIAVINAEDPQTVLGTTELNMKKIFYSLQTPAPGEIGLVENLLVDRAFQEDASQAASFAELTDIVPTVPHNVSNAMAAAALALALGATHDQITKGLRAFTLDAHRLEVVLEAKGITWVDDSKATNPHAASAALHSHLSNIWIAGGLAKGASMDSLVEGNAARIKAAILIGKDRIRIKEALDKYAPHIPVYEIEQSSTAHLLMEEVVSKALEIATTGDRVLLAPACASMDQFNDYKERGDLFQHAVRKLVTS